MSNGLKNLQSASRSGSRRDRLESVASISGYDDDSGIGGIGLTPVDELDPSFSSPETSPSGSSSSGHAAQQHHHRQQMQQQQQQHQHHQQQSHRQMASSAHLQALGGAAPANSYGMAYTNGYNTHHGYSSSVSSTASASFHGHPGSAPTDEQYYRGSRLGSSDMDIGALINHSGGAGRTH